MYLSYAKKSFKYLLINILMKEEINDDKKGRKVLRYLQGY